MGTISDPLNIFPKYLYKTWKIQGVQVKAAPSYHDEDFFKLHFWFRCNGEIYSRFVMCYRSSISSRKDMEATLKILYDSAASDIHYKLNNPSEIKVIRSLPTYPVNPSQSPSPEGSVE